MQNFSDLKPGTLVVVNYTTASFTLKIEKPCKIYSRRYTKKGNKYKSKPLPPESGYEARLVIDGKPGGFSKIPVSHISEVVTS